MFALDNQHAISHPPTSQGHPKSLCVVQSWTQLWRSVDVTVHLMIQGSRALHTVNPHRLSSITTRHQMLPFNLQSTHYYHKTTHSLCVTFCAHLVKSHKRTASQITISAHITQSQTYHKRCNMQQHCKSASYQDAIFLTAREHLINHISTTRKLVRAQSWLASVGSSDTC